MEEYITVTGEGAGEYEEKHSKFLGFVMPCKTERQAAEIIAEKRKKYWDARHAVYAFVLSDGTARFSDDGEPHGTAGKPVLDIIKSSGISDALVVVVRYFGGILLGTGGLVRAYSAAAMSAIENSQMVRVVAADKFSVKLDYGDYDKLLFLLSEFGAALINTDFSDTVSIVFTVRCDRAEMLKGRISDAFSSSVVPKFEEKCEMYEKIEENQGSF